MSHQSTPRDPIPFSSTRSTRCASHLAALLLRVAGRELDGGVPGTSPGAATEGLGGGGVPNAASDGGRWCHGVVKREPAASVYMQ
jgi:hypothetical protein